MERRQKMGLSKKASKDKSEPRKIKRKFNPKAKPIWEELLEIANSIPEEELDKLPRDGAKNHDKYLYGSKG